MTGPPNSFTARGPSHTDHHFVYTASCVKTTLALPNKNSDAKKLRRIFQVPMKTRPFSAGVNCDRIGTIT